MESKDSEDVKSELEVHAPSTEHSQIHVRRLLSSKIPRAPDSKLRLLNKAGQSKASLPQGDSSSDLSPHSIPSPTSDMASSHSVTAPSTNSSLPSPTLMPETQLNSHPTVPQLDGDLTNNSSRRVMDRLMGEVDQLKRELRLQTALREDKEKRADAAQSALKTLQSRLETLETICETSNSQLERRERKMDDYKANLDSERQARIEAEKKLAQQAASAEKARLALETELSHQKELSLYTQTQHTALSDSFRRMDARYRSSLAKIRQDVVAVRKQQQADQGRFTALEEINTQLNAELNRTKAASTNLKQKHEQVTLGTEAIVKDLRTKVASHTAACERIFGEVSAVQGQFLYVKNVRRDLREEAQA